MGSRPARPKRDNKWRWANEVAADKIRDKGPRHDGPTNAFLLEANARPTSLLTLSPPSFRQRVEIVATRLDPAPAPPRPDRPRLMGSRVEPARTAASASCPVRHGCVGLRRTRGRRRRRALSESVGGRQNSGSNVGSAKRTRSSHCGSSSITDHEWETMRRYRTTDARVRLIALNR